MKTSISACLLAVSLAVTATVRAAQSPGLLNSFTRDVWINGTRPDGSSAGRAMFETGQAITTRNGMAERLLGPRSFLRLGARSVVRRESSGERGRYGPPVIQTPAIAPPPAVPLTAPGVPKFPALR